MEKNLADGNNNVRHERNDADVRGIAFSGLALGVGTIIVCFLVYFMFRFLTNVNPVVDTRVQLPPEPRIQVHPWEEYGVLKTSELQQLHSYQWVNKKDGIVRIPIDRAMDLLLQRGLPTRKESDVKK
jgi:hypothetical protein